MDGTGDLCPLDLTLFSLTVDLALKITVLEFLFIKVKQKLIDDCKTIRSLLEFLLRKVALGFQLVFKLF